MDKKGFPTWAKWVIGIISTVVLLAVAMFVFLLFALRRTGDAKPPRRLVDPDGMCWVSLEGIDDMIFPVGSCLRNSDVMWDQNEEEGFFFKKYLVTYEGSWNGAIGGFLRNDVPEEIGKAKPTWTDVTVSDLDAKVYRVTVDGTISKIAFIRAIGDAKMAVIWLDFNADAYNADEIENAFDYMLANAVNFRGDVKE